MSDAEQVKELLAQAEGEPFNGIPGAEPKVNVWEMQDGSYVVHHIGHDGRNRDRERYDNRVTAMVEADTMARGQGYGGIQKRVSA